MGRLCPLPGCLVDWPRLMNDTVHNKGWRSASDTNRARVVWSFALPFQQSIGASEAFLAGIDQTSSLQEC